MATDCERYEIDLGMRSRGALDAKEDAALAAHLTTCADCRHFAESNDELDADLRSRIARETARFDWSKLERRIARQRRLYRLNFAIAPLLVLGPPLGMLIGGRDPLRLDALAIGVGIALLYMLSAWLWSRPLMLLGPTDRRTDDLLQGYLRELRRQRFRATFGGVSFTLLGIAWLILSFTEPEKKWWHLFNFAFWCSYGAFSLLRVLPRIRREIAELQS